MGVSIGYFITTEGQRRRWWAYLKDLARKQLMLKGEKKDSNTDEMDGITIEHVVSPETNITNEMRVDLLTIPPKRQLKGKSAGVECYVVWKGNLTINDTKVTSSNNVVEPYVERTLANPSSTTSTVVWRSTDGPVKDTIVEHSSLYESTRSYFESGLANVSNQLPSWKSTTNEGAKVKPGSK